MAEKEYYPETIEETPYPNQEGEISFATDQKTGNEQYDTPRAPAQPLPTRRVAYELLGNQLNTRSRKILAEFQFTQQGAIQIGKYENGISGDIRISPNGITGRDSSGNTTFAIDSTTGNAVFKGEVQAGTFISGLVVVGDNSVVIDGEARRMVFYDENDIPVILIGNA